MNKRASILPAAGTGRITKEGVGRIGLQIQGKSGNRPVCTDLKTTKNPSRKMAGLSEKHWWAVKDSNLGPID